MRATGVVRNMDQLGRIVFPIELRRNLGLKEKDSFEIFIDGDKIILRKYQPACIFCGEAKDVLEYKNKKVCKKCIQEIY